MYISVMHSKQKLPRWQVTPETIAFLIIVIHHYLSLVSQLSVNYVRCLYVTACCDAKHDFFLHIGYVPFPFT